MSEFIRTECSNAKPSLAAEYYPGVCGVVYVPWSILVTQSGWVGPDWLCSYRSVKGAQVGTLQGSKYGD